MRVKVSIVEDNLGTRESIVELLGRAPGLRCVGAHATGEAALRDIPGESPDGVLMDINLPGMSGVQCVAQLKEALSQAQVVLLTNHEETEPSFGQLWVW